MEVIYNLVKQYNIQILLAMISFLILLSIIVIISLFKIRSVNKRYYLLMKGVNGGNLESMLLSHLDNLELAKEDLKSLDKRFHSLSKQLETCMQGMAVTRYNPFSHMGGDQSFSIAMLNEKGSGFVLTSLYSREGSAVFAKPIEDYKSKYPLSEEELGVIESAQKGMYSQDFQKPITTYKRKK